MITVLETAFRLLREGGVKTVAFNAFNPTHVAVYIAQHPGDLKFTCMGTDGRRHAIPT